MHGRTKYGAAAHTIVQRWTDCQLETQERVAEKSFGGGNQRLGVGGWSQCNDTCDSAVRSRSSAAASRNLRAPPCSFHALIAAAVWDHHRLDGDNQSCTEIGIDRTQAAVACARVTDRIRAPPESCRHRQELRDWLRAAALARKRNEDRQGAERRPSIVGPMLGDDLKVVATVNPPRGISAPGRAFHLAETYLSCLGARGRIVILDCFLDPRGCFFQILQVHGRVEFDLRIESKEPGFSHRWYL